MTLTVNGERRHYADGLTLADLIAATAPSAQGIAVAVDSVVAPRGSWAGIVLSDGQSVEVLTAVQGG